MHKPAFQIEISSISDEELLQSRLLVEVNPHAFTYVMLNQRNMSPLTVKYFQLEIGKDSSLADTLHRLPIDVYRQQRYCERPRIIYFVRQFGPPVPGCGCVRGFCLTIFWSNCLGSSRGTGSPGRFGEVVSFNGSTNVGVTITISSTVE